MKLAAALLSTLAAIQLAVPPALAAGATAIMVPLCGALAGHSVPLRIPAGKDAPCCGKICHISMRKRVGGDSCCGEEDDDVA